MCDPIEEETILEKIMRHFVLQCFTQNFEDFGLRVILKKQNHKIKCSKNLQKSLHLEYYYYNPSQQISSTYCQYLIRN